MHIGRRLGLAVMLVGAVGCGSGTSSGTAPPCDGGCPQLTSADEAFLDKFCGLVEGCCVTNAARPAPDLAGCKRQVAENGFSRDPAVQSACLTELQGLAGAGIACFPDIGDLTDPCARIYYEPSGTHQPGEPCTVVGECAGAPGTITRCLNGCLRLTPGQAGDGICLGNVDVDGTISAAPASVHGRGLRTASRSPLHVLERPDHAGLPAPGGGRCRLQQHRSAGLRVEDLHRPARPDVRQLCRHRLGRAVLRRRHCMRRQQLLLEQRQHDPGLHAQNARGRELHHRHHVCQRRLLFERRLPGGLGRAWILRADLSLARPCRCPTPPTRAWRPTRRRRTSSRGALRRPAADRRSRSAGAWSSASRACGPAPAAAAG
jgi:hypothetical protein